MSSRVANAALRSKIMSADDAAALIQHGDNVGMSGFTGAGYPKAVPAALASRMSAAHQAGDEFKVGVWTGASTAPELDGALAEADGVELRLPYQSDPISRAKINAGTMEYIDVHLSHVAQMTWEGFLGKLNCAVVEVTAVNEDGTLLPSASVGNNKTWIDQADKVILEVNSWQRMELQGMHDIYYGTALPPHRKPLPIVDAADRIGDPFFRVDPDKVIAIVETDAPDRNTPFKPLDEDSKAIAAHLMDFLELEVRSGRMPEGLLPLQSGVGNIANAVLAGLSESPWKGLKAYTEVLQDGMLDLIENGTIEVASATAFSLSPEGVQRFNDDIDFFNKRIIMRPQEISNHPEAIRRLGVIASNGLIEADIYGNVNSTHIMGSRIQNGIGGSGDFARNAYLSTFVTPSTAKGGALSCIVPMVTHVDHTEHDVQVLITEQGLADLRGCSPRKRAQRIIDNCAHPDFKPMLQDYFDRAQRGAWGLQTPHLLGEAFSWHERFMQTGTMRQG
ncbi:acetyl-CoA hydrolase/transferase family protein [Arsenicicoccus dermatophilus]|uniref:acetyl-CoA hydrolase/transferase family protein n=1 Tax=Arsenicicoccus dermatophilus TaxID=1076331 RepID=UPI001F4D0B41|nr:acetyl-CoA hydrolase/transferase family protein [Arsenicicoccus dermatophilus]MCH8612031.1 acetyl-CoA hydrolase/transferase family protein [Arsenicicoccus dermatophilus]